jgi:hypothetical protein
MECIIKIVSQLLLLGCSLSVTAQLPVIRMYMEDGHVKEYRMEDIEEIDFVSWTNNMVMRLYQQNEPEKVYPLAALDNFTFLDDPPGSRVLNATIFSQSHNYQVADIDSIVFQRLEPKIAGCVVVINSDNANAVLNIDEASVTFTVPSELSDNINKGCIIVSEPIQQAPYGFVRKVTGISIDGSKMVVHTGEGSLSDVIENGVITFQVSFLEDDIEVLNNNREKYLETADTEKWIRLIFEKEIIDGLKFTGEIKVQPAIDFYMIIEGFTIKEFFCQLNTKIISELKAESELKSELVKYKKSLNEILGLQPIELQPITVMVGPVPFVFTPSIDIQVGCDINIAAKVSATYSADGTALSGFSYHAARTAGPWEPLFNSTSKYNFSPMQLSLGGSLKPFIGPQLNMNLYKVSEFFNLYAGIFGYLLLEVDVLNMPLWKLHGGVETAAGIDSEWFPELKYTVPLTLKEEILIAQAQNLVTSVLPQTAAIGDTITIKGSWFGSGDGLLDNLSFVAFKFGQSVLPGDMALANNYVNWKDDEIQVVVPDGIPVPPDGNKEIEIDLLLNIQGYYNNWTKIAVAKRPEINQINPQHFKPGDMVTISGKGFGLFRLNNDYVYFNGVRATSYAWWEDEMIIVEVPEDVESSNTNGHYGTDNFGFSALPGGLVDASGNHFDLIGNRAIWWSSTERSENDAWVWYIDYHRGYLVRGYSNKTIGWSPGLNVRCVRDSE